MTDIVTTIWLFILALGAAIVNGAVGYGFSSIVTPVALLWINPLVLLPALVAVEVAVNVTLLYRERRFIPQTKHRAVPVIYGLLPGIIIGTIALSLLATSAPNTVKIIVYALLLPLVIIQLLGIRRPVSNEQRAGPLIGAGIGFLYALTTISGPPLAVFWRNQGMSKDEFRCTMATIRTAESTMTLGTYLAFQAFIGTQFYTSDSLTLIPVFLVAVVIGVPVGTLLLRTVSREFFARLVMGVDGLIVSYGLANTLNKVKAITLVQSYILTAGLFVLFGVLTYLALRRAAIQPDQPPGGSYTSTPVGAQGEEGRPAARADG